VDEDFEIGEVRFKVLRSDYRSRETDSDGVVLLKPLEFAEAELATLRGIRVERMLEIGLWQGGSAILWPLLIPSLSRYVGIDIKTDEIAWPKEVTSNPRWGSVTIRQGVSQDDAGALRNIMDTDFDGSLDFVLDDASHLYGLTRSTFETCFPRLRAGGAYIIEDWSWAHWEGDWQESDHRLADEPAMSSVVLQLVMLAGTRRDVITDMLIDKRFVVVFRGPAELGGDFSLDSVVLNRGRPLPMV
jgi:SAM-dependent methyltransferase